MAVLIKSKNPMSLLKVFDCSISDRTEFKDVGGCITASKGLLIFSQYDDPLVSLPIKEGVLNLVMANKLGDASKAALKHKVHKSLEQFLKLAKNNKHKPKPMDFLKGDSSGSFDSGSLDDYSMTTVVKPSIDINTVLQMKPVKLSTATRMYQPVTATSNGSVYHVVCIAEDLIIAARFCSGVGISIRVEGEISKHLEALSIAGFGGYTGDDNYLSLHLKTMDTVLATRSIGAVLALIPGIKSMLPNLVLLDGEGS